MGRSHSAAPVVLELGGGRIQKTALGVLGSLALVEFRVRTLLLIHFKRRISTERPICSYMPRINVPYFTKLTSLYLALTEGREDNLFLLPVQTPPAQCYIALCFPCFAASVRSEEDLGLSLHRFFLFLTNLANPLLSHRASL